MVRSSSGRAFLNNFLDCFRCCGNNGRDRSGDYVLQPLNLFNPRAQTSVNQLLEAASAAREAVYARLGELEPLALTHSSDTALVGTPRWPAQRQAFRVIKRADDTAIIVSDGLSDAFDDLQSEGNVSGFGLEFFVVTPQAELGSSLSEIKQSVAFQLLYTVCSLAAGHGGIRTIIDDMELLSTEAEGVSDAIPEAHRAAHVNRASRVGALLGLKETHGTDSPESELLELTKNHCALYSCIKEGAHLANHIESDQNTKRWG